MVCTGDLSRQPGFVMLFVLVTVFGTLKTFCLVNRSFLEKF